MGEPLLHLANALIAPLPTKAETWVEHLKSLIVADWRPGEFDFEGLLFIPDPSNPRTMTRLCPRAGCGMLIGTASLCQACKAQWSKAGLEDDSYDEWLSAPRVRVSFNRGCSVEGCPRDHGAHGLCRCHAASFIRWKRRTPDISSSAHDWTLKARPQALPPLPCCDVEECNNSREYQTGLCAKHQMTYKHWCRSQDQKPNASFLQAWFDRDVEPLLNPEKGLTYSEAVATPFALLPEPLRWEFIYAVQQRDIAGRAHLDPTRIRSTYLDFRRTGKSTVVGEEVLVANRQNPNLKGMLDEWQRLISDAHRNWSGVDPRNPRIIFLQDLTLNKSTRTIGPGAKIDLRLIQNDWIFDSLADWIRADNRGHGQFHPLVVAWRIADEVLTVRGVPRKALGAPDVDAIVQAIRDTVSNPKTQSRYISYIDSLIQFARSHGPLHHIWGKVPSRFVIDPSRHSTQNINEKSAANSDEPFRFVPQPIVDWVMDRLHFISRHDAYATAEAKIMIFLQERCGRRTIETTQLKEDCISYDSQQAPYLEWRKGKVPYDMGKRLPLHQETHDVIRQWQEVKRQHGITSEWLFPSRHYSELDKCHSSGFLAARLRDLIEIIQLQDPFDASVEGADGNLIYFDLASIDPYSFRHSFAQRLADATDDQGRSTTSAEVLQEYMGHKNYNTTMAYYEVTSKRRKKAMHSLPARRLNVHGEVVSVSRERDSFGKVAVTLGHCSEPQNVAAGGHHCPLEHACESCPFFLVDPLERDGIAGKRHELKVKLERAAIINSPQHILDHYTARIDDCTKIIDGIDAHIESLPEAERSTIREAQEYMADLRRRATAPRKIDLRTLLLTDVHEEQ